MRFHCLHLHCEVTDTATRIETCHATGYPLCRVIEGLPLELSSSYAWHAFLLPHWEARILYQEEVIRIDPVHTEDRFAAFLSRIALDAEPGGRKQVEIMVTGEIEFMGIDGCLANHSEIDTPSFRTLQAFSKQYATPSVIRGHRPAGITAVRFEKALFL